jgi:hypothetical protein
VLEYFKEEVLNEFAAKIQGILLHTVGFEK